MPAKTICQALIFQGTCGQIPLPSLQNHIINHFLPFAWEKKKKQQSVTTKQVTLRCVSNFFRNINFTYCSKGNMECLPSSCEKSLSKNCASLLYIVITKNRANWPVHPTSEETTGLMLDLTPPMASTPGD